VIGAVDHLADGERFLMGPHRRPRRALPPMTGLGLDGLAQATQDPSCCPFGRRGLGSRTAVLLSHPSEAVELSTQS
jgi:hypothetical protein